VSGESCAVEEDNAIYAPPTGPALTKRLYAIDGGESIWFQQTTVDRANLTVDGVRIGAVGQTAASHDPDRIFQRLPFESCGKLYRRIERCPPVFLRTERRACGTAACQWSSYVNDKGEPTPSVELSIAEKVAKPVVYRLPGMDRVHVISNLKYSEVDNPYLLMDVYVPPDLNSHERRPVVILIHGGAGFEHKPKDWGIFQSWGRLFAAAGIVTVAFTHRFSPPPQPLLAEATTDLGSAIDYIRANSEAFQADPDRIGFCAWSAGGALLNSLLGNTPVFIRCVVALFALLDLKQYAPPEDALALQFLKGFSAIECLPEDASRMIPMLIARAGRDDVPMLNEALARFAAKALEANAPITVINHPLGLHGFDNLNDDERSREIVRSVIEFVVTHLQLRPPE
jgi:acetyl esterase/lipase